MRGFKHILHLKFSILLAVLLMTLCIPGWSQQEEDPVYTQYMNNLMSVNPAYTAVRGVGSISGIFRNQWVNLKGAPVTTSLTFSMPIDSLHMGLGVDFMNDNTQPLSTSGLFFNYSYRIRADENSQISFGLKAGANYMSANLTDLYRHDDDDSYILQYGDFKRLLFNVGVGIFWYSQTFYVGFSIPRLLENRYVKNANIVGANSREKQHYFLQGGYMIDLSPTISFKPGFTSIMTAGAPITADFDFSFLFSQKVWFGLMYRISDGPGAYTQFQYKNMKIGLSYDYTTTRLKEFQDGTFEVMLRYEFKTKGYQSFPLLTF